MTQNQIEYWKLRESLRHNTAVENESERSARATLRETRRSNRVKERETGRHNASSESIDLFRATNDYERNQVYKQDIQNRYELGVVGNALSNATLEHKIAYDNSLLEQDWNKALLNYKASLYGSDASKTVGLANASAAQMNARANAMRVENDYELGKARNEIEKSRAATYEGMRDDNFIIQSARNRADRDRVQLQEDELSLREGQFIANSVGQVVRTLGTLGIAAGM